MGRRRKERARTRREAAHAAHPRPARAPRPDDDASSPREAHVSVLPRETLELLAVRRGGFYVDGTVGLGGHAAQVLAASAPDGRLLGTDRDAEILARAAERLLPFGDRARLVHADFRSVPERLGAERPDGILVDLGVSSVQLDTPERGFSFRADGPLDMRMDRSAGESAADVVNGLEEEALADLIYRWGEERASRRIARRIVAARETAPITTTAELAAIVRKAGPPVRPGLDPATRTFQALRIHVNRELEGLQDAMVALAHTLAEGGRLVVIAFHSLEDREVKLAFRALAAARGFRILTKKPVEAGEDEIAMNPRARSAKLRAIERERAAHV